MFTSSDLIASAKFIGRECASVNKAFLLCKKNSENPADCVEQGDLVTQCGNNVMTDLKKNFPTEFENFSKCLDYNDYRYENCKNQFEELTKAFNAASSTQK